MDDGPRRKLFPKPNKYMARGAVSHRPPMGISNRYVPREIKITEERSAEESLAALKSWMRRAKATGHILSDPDKTSDFPFWPEWVSITCLYEEASAYAGFWISKARVASFISRAMPGIKKTMAPEIRPIGKGTRVRYRRTHVVYQIGPWRSRDLTDVT